MGSIHKLAEHYRKGIAEQGRYDFLGVGLSIDQDLEVDLFLYDLGSDSTHLIGVYDSDFDSKEEESKNWRDYFLEEGFQASRSLKSVESLSKGFEPTDEFTEGVYWSETLTERELDTILSKLDPLFQEDLEVYRKLEY